MANYKILRKVYQIMLILLLIFFTFLMIRLSVPYIGLETDVAFLRIKQWVFRTFEGWPATIWIIAFFIHVFTSIFSVIAGFTQFNRNLLWGKIHRTFGKIYIIAVLLFAAPTGFVMGIFANGGWISITAFILLALLWWYFTFEAYRSVRKKNFDRHARFMYLSYALTLSAITLRLWKFMFANLEFNIPPMDLYRIVAWLGWVPNLAVALVLIYFKNHQRLLGKARRVKSNQFD
ncbi:MAG: putative membrane protein [Arenicella sp.]|jgi:uncharacterized membrane protein